MAETRQVPLFPMAIILIFFRETWLTIAFCDLVDLVVASRVLAARLSNCKKRNALVRGLCRSDPFQLVPIACESAWD